VNDTFDNCVCAGVTRPDTDSDGILDCSDNRPNLAGEQGDKCDDLNTNTTGDVITTAAPGFSPMIARASPSDLVMDWVTEDEWASAYVWSTPLYCQIMTSGDTIVYLTDADNGIGTVCVTR
jgi:hypothetical protein